jgi:hypothetical protein
MARALLCGAGVLVIAAAVACSKPAAEPLQLDGNLLTVTNGSSSDWNHVEIWLNRYFRATAASIPAGGRFQAPLDGFISGYGQRFDFKRIQVKELRLTATLPDGKPLTIEKALTVGGLAGALGKQQR